MLIAQRILLLVAPFFVAADGSSTTSSAPAATQSIQVGAEGLSFTPTSVSASVGEIIEFRFYPQNHSVARADFESPCIPYEDTGAGRVGFWSGFHPVAVVLSNPPVFQVLVNDTDPIFFYCAAPGACTNNGMVGVINPNSTETFATQQAYAMNSTIEFAPGQYFPAESVPTPSTTTSPTPSSPTTTTAVSTNIGGGSKISVGAIVGIVISGLIVLIIFATLIYVCGRQKTMGEILHHSQFGSPNYGGQTPITPSTGFPPRSPNAEIDALGFRHFSGQTSPRTAVASEIYGPSSRTNDEGRDNMLPNSSLNGSLKTASLARADSPLMGKPTPRYPGQITTNPMTPSASSEIPGPLRLRVPPGPHEIMSSSDRDYVPNQSPVVKEESSVSENLI